MWFQLQVSSVLARLRVRAAGLQQGRLLLQALASHPFGPLLGDQLQGISRLLGLQEKGEGAAGLLKIKILLQNQCSSQRYLCFPHKQVFSQLGSREGSLYRHFHTALWLLKSPRWLLSLFPSHSLQLSHNACNFAP